jgi:DNA-binding CsgD family transcriptional regulator
LPPREREVLALVSTGTTNADISRRLHVSLATVKSHLFNAYRKLGVSNRVEATRLYLDQYREPVAPPPGPRAFASANAKLGPSELDHQIETLATVADEAERLRRQLEDLRATRRRAGETA